MKKNIKIDLEKKEQHRQFMNERILKELSYLIEGIDINTQKRTVSFNLNHENNVNTSITLNPTHSEINGVPVVSIFKRKRSENVNLDGNPLIYALKGINGWKFNNPKKDIIGLLRQFIRISEKIKPKYDTIITIPSTNELNTQFLHRLSKIINTDFQITDYFRKITATEVYEDFVDWDQIDDDFGNRSEKLKKDLKFYLNKMHKENKGYFSYKFIKDIELRKYITKTAYSDEGKSIEYAPHINGKDILILDDTIASGNTISEICGDIFETFTPKSTTVITLFSKL